MAVAQSSSSGAETQIELLLCCECYEQQQLLTLSYRGQSQASSSAIGTATGVFGSNFMFYCIRTGEIHLQITCKDSMKQSRKGFGRMHLAWLRSVIAEFASEDHVWASVKAAMAGRGQAG